MIRSRPLTGLAILAGTGACTTADTDAFTNPTGPLAGEESTGTAGNAVDAGSNSADDPGLPNCAVRKCAEPDASDASDARPGSPEHLADPFQDPGTQIAFWKGKLPPVGKLANDVEVSYPSAAPPSQGYPLVVFAHGFQVGVDMYRATMDHIAKFGYVAASVDYEGNLFSQDHHAPADSVVGAIDMLTSNPPAELGSIVNANLIAAAGHSTGAKGAIWLSLEDDRIKTVVALDPIDDDPSPIPIWSDKRPSLAPERMGDMSVPVLYLAAELSPRGQPCAYPQSNSCRFFESTPAGSLAWLGIVQQFGHMQFLDPYNCLVCLACQRGPEFEHERQQRVVRGLMVAFLEAQLRDKTGYMDLLEGKGRAQLETDQILLDPAEQESFCSVGR